MDYFVYVPDFAVGKPFSDFTANDAKAYLDWYLEIIPSRIQLLESRVQMDIPDWKADFSEQSIARLDTWYIHKVGLQPMSDEETLEHYAPILAHKLVEKGIVPIHKKRLSDETISLCFDLGIYLGECLIRCVPNLSWGYRIKPKNYLHYARPILVRGELHKDFDPEFAIVADLEFSLIESGSSPEPFLMRLFEYSRKK